ncbi:MAG: toll/interleukin-1 receptor domain-containing protein [Planctomycetes bacterium]|nr:toll/interleukin-1 receptor domain-containing protein [Planctomycetota bacterium]
MAEQVAAHLGSLGVKPMYDKDILVTTRFSEEIRWRVSCAHIFVCILTTQSQRSSWVISELGYAMGVGVPVLPLSLDELPAGLAHEIHAIRIDRSLSDLAAKLTPQTLDDVVDQARTATKASFECADRIRQRSEMLVTETGRLYRYAKSPLYIRQRGAFTSFGVPDVSPDDDIWAQDGPWKKHSIEERIWLRKERHILEEQAEQAGCDLIIDPYVVIEDPETATRDLRPKYSHRATAARLEILRDFLRGQSSDRCAVCICRGRIQSNLTILGDWLAAEAVVPHYKSGFRQTIFTRHAPTVQNRIEEFNQEFNDGLRRNSITRQQSREFAINAISQIIAELSGK